MILKIFRCRVPVSTRERFLSAQRQWKRLQSVDGFLAQRCGFDEGDATACVILALWRDRPSLERFMDGEHDRIVDLGEQASTYVDGRVDLAIHCGDVARETPDPVEGLTASEGVTLIEFEGPPGDGVPSWRVLESTASFIAIDFERDERRSPGVARESATRTTHIRWIFP